MCHYSVVVVIRGLSGHLDSSSWEHSVPVHFSQSASTDFLCFVNFAVLYLLSLHFFQL